MTSDLHLTPDPRRVERVRVAQALLADKKRGRHIDLGFDSFVDYAATLGHTARESRALLDLARVLDALPALAPFVEAGAVSFEAARALAPVARDPAVRRLPPRAEAPLSDGDGAAGWAEAARTLPLVGLEDEVERAVERVRVWPQPVIARRIDLNREQRAQLERAKALASEMYERPISTGEMLEIATHYYLERNDPERRNRS